MQDGFTRVLNPSARCNNAVFYRLCARGICGHEGRNVREKGRVHAGKAGICCGKGRVYIDKRRTCADRIRTSADRDGMRRQGRDTRRELSETGVAKFVKSAQQSLTFALFSSDDLLH